MQQIDFDHFVQIVQQTSDGIISTDVDFNIKSWNPAAKQLYEFTEAEVFGKKLGDFLKSRLDECNMDPKVGELQEKGFFEGDYICKNKNGAVTQIGLSVFVLKEADDKESGYVTIHRNITEQKEREAKLVTQSARLEEQVKEKAAQLTAIFERITDAFVALDKNWCYTYMNKRAGEVFGKIPANMIGKNIWAEFPEGIDQPFYHAYYRAMKEQQYIHLEEYYPPYQRWFENHIYPSPEGLSIFFRDITDNKQMEEYTKLSNQRLLLHLTNSPLAAIEWNNDLLITEWSEQAVKIFGWERREVIGKTIEELNLVFVEDVPIVAKVVDALMAGSMASSKVINRNNTKNGEVIYCEWYNSVLKNESGSIVSCMSLVQDITDKKRAEDVIAFNEQQLKLIYNSSSDVLYLLSVEQNQDFRFTSVNEAFRVATGLQTKDIIGRKIEEVVPYPSSNLVIEKYRIAIAKRQTVRWEEVTPYPAGIKTGLVSITPVFDNNGNCVSLVGSVHDVTENKRAEAELLEKNEQLRSLSAHLQDVREEERAHIAREIHDELGERLTALRLDISWLESQIASSLTTVKDKFPALIQIVDDTIKTVRKISTELRPSILDDFGLVDAIEWQAAEFEKRTGIRCKVQSTVNESLTDKKVEITLFRVFQESLTNISRHSKASRVAAKLLIDQNAIELRITDDGIGMDLKKVKSKQTLGLIGMKERVLMVNGDYNITSSIGKGTTIMVSVPLK